MSRTASSLLATQLLPSSYGTGLIASFKRPHSLRERCWAYADGDVSAHRIFTVHRAARWL
jgi:hypothetical protein